MFVSFDLDVPRPEGVKSLKTRTAIAVGDLSQEGVLGWVTMDRNRVVGRFYCHRRQDRWLHQIVEDWLGKQTPLVAGPLVEAPPIGLDRLFVAKRRKRPSVRSVRIDRVDHRGVIGGWAWSDRIERPDEFTVHVAIDGEPVGRVSARYFRLDLLQSGVGNGECVFKLQAPERYLDGGMHSISADAVDRLGTFAQTSVDLRLPRSFAPGARPWRTPPKHGGMAGIKHQIISNGVSDDALRRLREEIDRTPQLVFADAGIAEAFKRLGRHFPSFRERLEERAANTTSTLFRVFNSKSETDDYCSAQAIPVAETLLVAHSLDDLLKFDFPQRFALKPVIGSALCSFVYDDGVDLLTRSPVTMQEIMDEVKEYLVQFPDREFIVQEVLRPKGAQGAAVPPDYKFHVFGGKVRIIHVDDRNCFGSRDRLHRQQGWFAKDWTPSPFRFRINEEEAIDFAIPESLPQMIDLAERIGRDAQDYVRVDLYDTERGVVLGEVTTFSHGGRGFTEYGNFILSQAWFVS